MVDIEGRPEVRPLVDGEPPDGTAVEEGGLQNAALVGEMVDLPLRGRSRCPGRIGHAGDEAEIPVFVEIGADDDVRSSRDSGGGESRQGFGGESVHSVIAVEAKLVGGSASDKEIVIAVVFDILDGQPLNPGRGPRRLDQRIAIIENESLPPPGARARILEGKNLSVAIAVEDVDVPVLVIIKGGEARGGPADSGEGFRRGRPGRRDVVPGEIQAPRVFVQIEALDGHGFPDAGDVEEVEIPVPVVVARGQSDEARRIDARVSETRGRDSPRAGRAVQPGRDFERPELPLGALVLGEGQDVGVLAARDDEVRPAVLVEVAGGEAVGPGRVARQGGEAEIPVGRFELDAPRPPAVHRTLRVHRLQAVEALDGVARVPGAGRGEKEKAENQDPGTQAKTSSQTQMRPHVVLRFRPLLSGKTRFPAIIPLRDRRGEIRPVFLPPCGRSPHPPRLAPPQGRFLPPKGWGRSRFYHPPNHSGGLWPRLPGCLIIFPLCPRSAASP